MRLAPHSIKVTLVWACQPPNSEITTRHTIRRSPHTSSPTCTKIIERPADRRKELRANPPESAVLKGGFIGQTQQETRARQRLGGGLPPLALDILLHVPLRIEDLGALKFDKHVHWPQGKGKPALVVIRQAKEPDNDPLECELPPYLSDRLYVFRNEIATSLMGRRPEVLFISADGTPRKLSTLRVAIQRAVLRRVGIWITPHQFRHLAGMIHLDANPGHYEMVRQLLGHKTLKTTTRFYAGPNTRRAGRVHAELIRKLREPQPKPRNGRSDSDERNI